MLLLTDLLYLLVVLVAGPFWAVRRLIRRRPMPPLGARLGFVRVRSAARERVWVHGVSVGEILASRGLVHALRERGAEVLVTSTTVLGIATAQREFGAEAVEPCPLDFSTSVRRFLARTRPTALVLMELELWPNLLALTGRSGIPVLLVNARLSQRSQRGWKRILGFAPHLLDPLQRIAVQNAAHCERFRSLGIALDRLRVCGDLKADNARSRDATAEREQWRQRFACTTDEKVLVAGSTHEGEEELLLLAHAAVRQSGVAARLVLAPRHLERVEAVRRLAARHGRVVLLGDLPAAGGADIIIVDSMGQLSSLYAAADLAFVGGSLVPIGGHNLLEPAAVGVPFFTGPHLATVAGMAEDLEDAGVLQRARFSTAAECERIIKKCLGDASLHARAREGARLVIAAHAGALQRTLAFTGDLVLGAHKESVSNG